MSATHRALLAEVTRFCITGVLNTAVYYGIYLLLLMTGLQYLIAHIAAWFVSLIFSFFVNCYFTFRVRPTLRRFLSFPLPNLVNIACSTALSALLVSGLGASDLWGTLVAGIAVIPITFTLTRFVLKPRDGEAGDALPADASATADIREGHAAP